MKIPRVEKPLMGEMKLPGLDGANLLGYLAALGTLRVLTVAEPEAQVRMSWGDIGWWTPIINHSRICTNEELVAVLDRTVTPLVAVQPKKKGKKRPEDREVANTVKALHNANRAFRRDLLDISLADFRTELEAAAREPEQREVADFLTALGSDAFAENKDGEGPATTKFRAIGAGNNDGFLGYMRTLHLGTNGNLLHKALFIEWDYSDPPPLMRWDPNEYRPHALRADDPAKDNKRNNVRGANRLAIEALPMFPTVPGPRQLGTTGFDKDTISWPIWKEALDVGTVTSLLASEEVQKADRKTMTRRGVVQVFRAKRFTEGRYRNFTPAKAAL